ncbi:MAG: MBL fold metallo-hydrolase, partial [Verrucomicrobiota bacterium]|nr:MBL fold metallo-hydrolase [Verrucomicrobiota bacterium]
TFITGETFEIGDVTVENFLVPHDAQEPVGFHLKTSDGNIGILTDLGQATRLVLERVRGANVLFIEANYDLNLLQQDTRRPWSIKQRIMSRHGHLSNTATAEAVRNLADNSLRYVMLGHLSQDCNTPEIAQQTVATELEQAGIDCIQINVSTQSKASETLTI